MTSVQSQTTRGFALVITLIMLVLAAVLAIALLTNATLDRTTAKSVADRFQAELAVQNGLEAAKRSLTMDATGNLITQDDSYLVVRVPGAGGANEDDRPHYYFVGQTKGQGGQIQYHPLFSGGPSPAPIAATALPTYVTPTSNVANNLPRLLPDPADAKTSLLPSVTTQWLEVPNAPGVASNAPRMRYCFWIEDLGGYINASTAGNTFGKNSSGANNETHTRDPKILEPLLASGTAKTTSLLAMWTVFNPASPLPSPGSDEDIDNKSIVSQRSALFTSETIKQAVASSTDKNYLSKISRHFIARTKSDLEQPVIPYAMGYHTTKEGGPKTDLNAMITAGNVNGIADTIKETLPLWASSRRGGFGGSSASAAEDSYRRTIAANIIDYADSNSDPTMGADHRGLDAFPLVNEFYDLVRYIKAYSKGANHYATIERTTYVELWNMTNKPVSGSVEFREKHVHPISLGNHKYSLGTEAVDLPNQSSQTGAPYNAQQVTLRPNEFKVIEAGKVIYELNNGPFFISTALNMDLDFKTSYELLWNGKVADKSLGGVEHKQKVVHMNGAFDKTNKWSGTLPGFSYTTESFVFVNNPGDPRSAFYITAKQAANAYKDNASMWGRNKRAAISSSNIYAEVKPSVWADTGHDTRPAGPVGDGTRPIPKPGNAPSTEETKALTMISNTGALKTVAEVGYIYDPAQWKTKTPGNRWTDIDSADSADSQAGGGFTLRIGRPEFTRFDQDGMRSSHLLDIFSVGSRRETEGLVNLNTATRETLRALGAGLLLNLDPDIQPATLKNALYPPTATAQADKFADAVISFRRSKPFLSPSQLAQLQDSGNNPFFGNPAQFPVAPTEWNDAAAEEYFSHVFDLSAVRSRNFRVFITGQYVDPRFLDASGNPRIVSTVNKVFHVFLQPTRGPNGAISNQRAEVTYEREL